MKPTSCPSTAASAASTARLVSLDQFRGYTVLGMFLVNYFASYQVCPRLFRHTHDYCSYADVIMPQFLFAVGFSLRMTLARRLAESGRVAVYRRVAKRLLGLALVSFVVYSVSPRAANWEALTELTFWGAIREPLKRQWFQTLMHIAVTSLWILPVLHARPAVRIGFAAAAGIVHVGLAYWFNFIWTNSPPNAINGGPLGFLAWTTPAILGTLAADWFSPQRTNLMPTAGPPPTASPALGAGLIPAGPEATGSAASSGSAATGDTPVASGVKAIAGGGGLVPPVWTPARALRRSIAWGLGCMLVAWLMSCGTRMYDVDTGGLAAGEDGQVATIDGKIAAFPVVPPASQIAGKWEPFRLSQWLAEPPFVPPPSIEQRKWNYWMMSQRGGTWSYTLFAGGFSMVLYALFYLLCDRCGYQLALFRTFGTNALLAYVLHGLVSDAVRPFFPRDSPAWFALIGLALFFLINWTIVRGIEKQGVFLRV